MTSPVAQPDPLKRAQALLAAGHLPEAARCAASALAERPDDYAALHLLGVIDVRRGRLAEAEAWLARALAIEPRSAEALYHRGVALQHLGRLGDALASYDGALAVRPHLAEAHNNRGTVLKDLGRYDDAYASFDRAVTLRPRYAEALHNRGFLLQNFGRMEQAIADFERALAADPALPFAGATLLHARMRCCDWQSHDEDVARLVAGVRAGLPAAAPFAFLAVSDSPQDQRRCAETWVNARCPPAPVALAADAPYRHDRIRIAYLSADFREHAVARLAAGLFERHDRTRFETTAIALGPAASGDPMRARLERAFERFVEVRGQSDADVARLVRELEIDVAVDLGGHTSGSRPGILALRPAPVQVNYLGFPGTMGAPYIDYIVADATVVPERERGSCVEAVVHLPDCYLANDSTWRIAERTPTRAEAGLPEAGVVFCSFNNSHKITPTMFAAWMRVLRAVDGSVLWLRGGGAAAERNLRREAAARGVAPERLVYAASIGIEDHLARHRLADLFLDTLPYNAHTTASDALWAGLPVLTCIGTTFAGRVAASMLAAVGLPELVTGSLAGYEALAVALATDPPRLAALKAKLEGQRASSALFDTDRFRRHLEAAYVTMWERAQRGLPPAAFAVGRIA